MLKKKSLIYIQMLIHYGDPLENNGAELKVPSSVHLIVWKLQKFSACFFNCFLFFSVVTISVKRADLDL